VTKWKTNCNRMDMVVLCHAWLQRSGLQFGVKCVIYWWILAGLVSISL